MIQQLKRHLKLDPNVNFAVLFGSRARKTHRSSSDWDLGIYFSKPPKDGPHGKTYSNLYWKLSRLLQSDNVDLVFLNFAPPVLAHKILSEGEPLVRKDKGEYVRYLVKLMGEVDDARHILQIHERSRKKKRTSPS